MGLMRVGYNYVDTKMYKGIDGKTIRLKVITLLGGKCCKCGISDIRVLEIDHVFGDGCLERVSYKPNQIHGMIIKSFELNHPLVLEIARNRYQVLCANCHKIKTLDNDENNENQLLRMASNLGCIQQVRHWLRLIEDKIYRETYERS